MATRTKQAPRAYRVGEETITTMPAAQGRIQRVVNDELQRRGLRRMYAEDGEVYDVEVRVFVRSQPRERWCKDCGRTRSYREEVCSCTR